MSDTDKHDGFFCGLQGTPFPGHLLVDFVDAPFLSEPGSPLGDFARDMAHATALWNRVDGLRLFPGQRHPEGFVWDHEPSNGIGFFMTPKAARAAAKRIQITPWDQFEKFSPPGRQGGREWKERVAFYTRAREGLMRVGAGDPVVSTRAHIMKRRVFDGQAMVAMEAIGINSYTAISTAHREAEKRVELAEAQLLFLDHVVGLAGDDDETQEEA